MAMGKFVNSLPEIFYLIIVPIKGSGEGEERAFFKPLLIICSAKGQTARRAARG